MKKYLYLMAALAIAAVSCKKAEPATPSITLSTPTEVTVPTDGGIQTVSFSSNVAWTASVDNSNWSVSPASGNAGEASVKVTAPNNTTEDPIVVKLTLKADKASQTVTFTQLQKDAMIVDVTSYEAPAEGGTVSVKVKANVEVTATTTADWITIPTPTKGLVEKTFDLTVSANEGDAREGIVVLSGAGRKEEVTISQAAFVPYFTIEEYEAAEDGNYYIPVTADGGKFNFTVSTNIPYEFEPYVDAFPTQHVVRNENKYEVTIDKNTTYNGLETYVKFTITGKDPETGGDVSVKIKVYFQQESLSCIKYSISMYDAAFDTWGTTVLSEAIYNGKHYVSNGQDLYEINPADGAYKKIDWSWGNGMTQKVITNDDAGNLIVCNHTAYTDDYLDGYFILNAVTPAGEEKNLITKAAWECGGPLGAKLKVRGDITSNALIVAPVEGISGITMSMKLGYWEVNGGVAGDYTQLTATGFIGTWSAGAWNTYPNNFPTIIAKGVTASEGFVMSGCYEENAVYAIDGTSGDCYKMLTPELYIGSDEVSGNLACQSISMTVIGGKTYLAMLASPHFPSYGPGWTGAPYLSILEVPATLPASPLNMWDNAKIVKICTSYFPWEADPATDWAINVAADVNLYDADGKIGVAFTDLNGRSIEAYEFDPAVL